MPDLFKIWLCEALSTGPPEEVVATEPQTWQRKCEKENEMDGQRDIQSGEGGMQAQGEGKMTRSCTSRQTLDYVNSPQQLQVRLTTLSKSPKTHPAVENCW